jgi:hypothetical protein
MFSLKVGPVELLKLTLEKGGLYIFGAKLLLNGRLLVSQGGF